MSLQVICPWKCHCNVNTNWIKMSCRGVGLILHLITSSNGNIFCVTGHLCREHTGHRWIPHTKASDVELWCFFFICIWINIWVYSHQAGDLRCHRTHYDATVKKHFGHYHTSLYILTSKTANTYPRVFQKILFKPQSQSMHMTAGLGHLSSPLQWRYNKHDGISNHQHLNCLLNSLFWLRQKKTSKLCITGLCEGNPLVTIGFPAKRVSIRENVSTYHGFAMREVSANFTSLYETN